MATKASKVKAGKAKPKGPTTKPESKRRPDGLRPGSAGAKLVDTVCRKHGATHAELCQVVGWKQCRPFLLKSAAQAKVKLRKERTEDGQVRYFGTPAPASPPKPA